MMHEIDKDILMGKVGSLYKLVVLASLRAIELSDGAAKLVDAPLDARVMNIALEEIHEGKISYKVKEKK